MPTTARRTAALVPDDIRRVVCLVDADARAVAWLHEAFERTAVAEHLMEGLDSEELRALRLPHRTHDSRSDRVYLSHLHLIERATGHAGRLARLVSTAPRSCRAAAPRASACARVTTGGAHHENEPP